MWLKSHFGFKKYFTIFIMIKFDPHKVAEIIRRTAFHDIMPLFRKLEKSQITNKQSGEIVTEADVRAEKRLTDELLLLLPGSLTIGEEAVKAEPKIEERLFGDKPVWVIDPVDGTRNYANGKKCFCVIVALCHGQQTIAGWIYDPIAEVMYFAEVGVGAWANGRSLVIPKPPARNKMTASLGKIRRDILKNNVSIRELPKRMLRYRCIGREYIDIVLGKIHFGEYNMLKPWDHAAGLLILTESGGYHAYIDTETPYKPMPSIVKKLLVTSSESEWHRLKNCFFDV